MRSTLFLSAACLVALTGCGQDEEIRQETVTHAAREEMRLRVAILPNAKRVWFVRMDGPAALVAEQKDAFEGFVRSTQFNKKNEPTWTEPKDWKKDPPVKGRFASYRVKAGTRELEVKITVLDEKEFNKLILANAHRWQKHVNLPLAESVAEYEEKYVKDELHKDQKITWVDMSGLGVHTVSKLSDANADNQNDMLALPGSEGRVPFKYTAPDDWTKQPPGQFAVDAYRVGDGPKTAEVTLTPLSGQMAGDTAMNINRWRDQVKLEKLPWPELQKTTKLIKVAGIQSYYVDLANPAGPPGQNRILGVIVPLSRRTVWFVKMTGPLEVIEQNKQAFETFVDSFKK